MIDLFSNTFPIEYEDHKIEVKNLKFIPPKKNDEKAQEEIFFNEETLTGKLRGDLKISKGDKVIIDDENILISNIPYPTNRGTFIIKGDENVIINQMLLRNGVYVKPKRALSEGSIIESEVRAGKKRFTIIYNTSRQEISIRDLGMDFGYSGKKLDAIAFLLFMGVTEAQIEEVIGDKEISDHMLKEAKKITPERIHNSFFDTELPETEAEIRDKINDYLNNVLEFDDRALKVQKETIGESFKHFTPEAFLQTIKQLVQENEQPGSTPSVDDIRFKEVLDSTAILTRSIESGVFEWTKKIKERIRRGNIKSSNVRPATYVDNSFNTLASSSLMERVDSGNPLDLAQKKRKITLGGPGGLKDEAVTEAARNLYESEFGKIDPIETSQSIKLGISQHLAKNAEIRDGEIYSKYHPVKNGEFSTSEIVNDIDSFDEYDEYIAFHDLEVLEIENGKGRFTEKEVRVRHKGDFINVPVDKVTLVDIKPDVHLGSASSLVPFSAHNDGSRMLMGSSMLRQALPLVEADAPLVQTVAEDGKTNEEKTAEEVSQILKSPTSGTVTRIAKDFITIEDSKGEEHKVKKLNYFSPGSSGGYINHKPTVKVGDKVKKGDLIADGWQTKGGKLALGKNTMIGYMSFDGYNHEDGVVVSESWAEKMASEEIKTIEYEVELEENIFPPSETKEQLKKLMVSDGILDKLDEDGVIKKGEEISNGDIFVALAGKKEQKDLTVAEIILQRSLSERPEDKITDRSKYAKGYQRGTVVDVKKKIDENKMKVSIKLLTRREMSEGDKISGRHGNKGTVSKIIPDDEMPMTEDGERLELIFSPLAVPSRKNVGQLLEVNAGMVAKKTGLDSYNVQNFDRNERKKLYEKMEELGMEDGKMTLINPKTGKPYENKVTVGPMFIMRLDHNAEGKIAATSYAAEDPLTGLPRKVSGAIDGDRTNPQTIGGMEFWSLTSAGAVHNIHEMTTLKSDGSGSAEDKLARLNIFNAIKQGTPIPEPATPQTLKVLQDQLMGAGVQMTPLRDGKETTIDRQFNELMLQPLKPATIESLAKGEVEEPKTFDARTGEEAKKGLYSEDVFGKDGDQWGRISLETPVPNPMFLRRASSKPYEAMLRTKGIKNSDLEKVVAGGQFIVVDPGETDKEKYSIISHEEYEELEDIKELEIEALTGPDALYHLLKDVDLEQELKDAERVLRPKDGEKFTPAERSDAERHFKTLSRALDNNYKPEDFLLPFVPVLPVKYRQPVKGGGDMLVEDGITLLYQNFMKKNSEYQKTLEAFGGDKSFIDKQTLAEIERDRYKSLSQIIGTDTYVDTQRGTEYEGILASLKSKKGFIRDKMQAKTQNYSGRSVIVVDPELGMDEAGIPEDMAAEIFKPNIHKELQRLRFTPKEIKTIMEERNDHFRKALTKAVKDEVVLLNRQPSLHKHSIQAFKPVIRWDTGNQKSKAIGLNAIVTTGFNADFDGDTMAVHVPITEKAKQEAKEKMLPSKNLLNPTSNSVITELKHEMQLGLYYLTRDKMPEGKPKRYANYEQLERDYFNGMIKTYDAVTLQTKGKGEITATAGKHLFNGKLPERFQDYKRNVNVKKGRLESIFKDIMNDPGLGPEVAAELINDLKTLGFKASTISAISIGVRDFDPIQELDTNKMFDEAEKKLVEDGSVANFIDEKDKFEAAKAGFVKDQIDTMLNEGVLGEDNHVNITLQSGARGGAGSLSAMGGVVGKLRNVSSEDIRPMKSSLIDGAKPDEFWDLSNDSRKGIYDRSVATSGPGELSRSLWMSNKQTVVTERDCGDTKGIILDLNKPTDSKGLFGRVLLEDVHLKGGGVIKKKKDKPLTPKEVEKIRKDAISKRIRVRSPLSCKTAEGVCQNCYGMKPGAMTTELVPLGEAVGSIASQAVGEPAQQSIMKTFHTGGGGNELSSAFEGTKNVLSLRTPGNKAVVVERAGNVEKIDHDPIKGTTVKVGGKSYRLGNSPISPDVKVGVQLDRGDVLTRLKDENGNTLTVLDPRDVLKYDGVEAAQMYLTDQIEESFKLGSIDHIDRRHTEVIVNNMTNRGVITDGGTTGFAPNQVHKRKELDAFNRASNKVINAALDYAERNAVIGAKAAQDYRQGIGFGPIIVKKGEVITEDAWEKLRKDRKFVKVYKKPVTYEASLAGIGVDNDMVGDSWLDSAARRDATRFITRGAGEFAVDKLDTPLTQQMTGRKGAFGDNFKNFADKMKDRFGETLI